MKDRKTRRAHGSRAARREAIEDRSIPIAERLKIERKQIFKVMGIVSCCVHARGSMRDENHAVDLIDALKAAHDLMDDVAAELQLLIEEHTPDT